MEDNNNNNDLGGDATFESWLEDLWRPFEGDSLPRMETVTGGTSMEVKNTNTNNSTSAPLRSEASTSSISSSTSSSSSRYTPYHTRIECKCPNGPGSKAARHWRTTCPFNAQRRSEAASCEACGRPFNRLDNLKRHLRDVHGIK